MPEYASGYVHGIVTNVNDPLKAGRVRAQIPGYFEQEHPRWLLPAAWPGAGAPKRGSRYPNTVGQQIAVFFELGDIEAPPIFLPGMYGIDPETNEPCGPPAAVAEDVDPNDRAIIWEDTQLAVFVVDKEGEVASERDKRIVLLDKRTGSNITLNASDGTTGNSASIVIEGNTSLTLRSNGIIDIDAPIVQIQGRRVLRGPSPGKKSI